MVVLDECLMVALDEPATKETITEELKFDMVLMRVRQIGMWDESDTTLKGTIVRWRRSLAEMLFNAWPGSRSVVP